MVLALVLAQLVLPGPPSKPLSPPGMICMGECSDGPMVWRASPARGRLVVACDMRSSTCSDGRTITTQRATPVPCETSPGVWEMVGVDEGCYSVRGLESWDANTSYLSYGAELDRSPWQAVEGATISGRILSGPTGSARLLQGGLPPEAGTWTLACRMRALSGNSVRLRLYPGSGDNSTVIPVTTGWATVFHTWEIEGEPTSLSAHIYPNGSTLEIAGCWLTRTDTPGRACWGGEAPVTCDADQHTISTEGWPTESGEICITVTFKEILNWNTLIRNPANNLRLEVRSSGALALNNITPTSLQIPAPRPVEGVPHVYCVGRSGSEVYLKRDGVKFGSGVRDAFDWGSVAELGRTTNFNGSISSLRVRSDQ